MWPKSYSICNWNQLSNFSSRIRTIKMRLLLQCWSHWKNQMSLNQVSESCHSKVRNYLLTRKYWRMKKLNWDQKFKPWNLSWARESRMNSSLRRRSSDSRKNYRVKESNSAILIGQASPWFLQRLSWPNNNCSYLLRMWKTVLWVLPLVWKTCLHQLQKIEQKLWWMLSKNMRSWRIALEKKSLSFRFKSNLRITKLACWKIRPAIQMLFNQLITVPLLPSRCRNYSTSDKFKN